MGWRAGKCRDALVVAVVVLLAGAAVGITVLVTEPFRGETTRAEPRPALGAQPARVWTLDVTQLTGNDNDVLLALPQTLQTYYGYGSVLDAPTTLVGAVGRAVTPDSTEGQAISMITLVGIDRIDGSAKWKRPIGKVTQCSDQLESGVITCWNDERVVFVDTGDGTLLSEVAPDFEVGRSEVVDGQAFVSGFRRDGSRDTLVLTGGTPTASASSFRRSFAVDGPVASVDRVLPAQNLFIISTQTGGATIYQSTVYDLDTGVPRFTIPNDLMNVVGEGLFMVTDGAQSGSVGTQELFAADGSLIVNASVPAYTALSWPTTTSAPAPVFLGDGVHDPFTGRERWRDRSLVTPAPDSLSTVRALAGNVAVIASAETQTLTGLDLQTGRQVWKTPWIDAYWIHDGLTDGNYYVFSDYSGIHSLRVADGTIVWSVPFPPGTDPRHANVSAAGGHILLTVGADISLWRPEPVDPRPGPGR